jgi:hypothetical protein
MSQDIDTPPSPPAPLIPQGASADDLDFSGETLGERQEDAFEPITCAGGCE